jgi:hypothetical protein
MYGNGITPDLPRSLPRDMTLYSDTELNGFVKLSEFKDALYDYLVGSRKSLSLSW